MNSTRQIPSSGTAGPNAFSRRDYRMHFLELNEPSAGVHDLRGERQYLCATAEFTFLTDTFLRCAIGAIVTVRLQRMGVDLTSSHVTCQGWAERFMRSAGLSGLDLPRGFFSDWAYRLHILKISLAYLYAEIEKDHRD